MSLQHAANYLASQGRGPDNTLVHMTRGEVQSLQDIARAHGGSLSINPETGLVEAGFLKNLLPMIAGMGLTALTGGAAAPWMIGLGVGGVQAARTGSLEKGLMAGLGAYGGAGLMGGITAAAGNTASELAAKDIALGGQGGSSAAAQYMPSATDNFMSGVKGLGTEAGRSAALNSLGGGFGAAKTAGMALAPALTDTGDQKAPASDNEQYQYKYDPGRVEDPNAGYTGAFTGERTYFKPSFTRLPNIKMSEGGIAHFDDGGPTDKEKTAGLQAAAAAQGVNVPFAQRATTTTSVGSIQPVASNPYYTMTGASGDAYKYLMGLGPSSAAAKPVVADKPVINTDNTSSIDSGTVVGVGGGGGGGGGDGGDGGDGGGGDGGDGNGGDDTVQDDGTTDGINDVIQGMDETAQDDGTTQGINDVIEGMNETAVDDGTTQGINDIIEGMNETAVDDGTTQGINDVIEGMGETAQDDGTTAGINDVIENMGETAQDDGTTQGINDVIQNMGETNPYEVQPWENLDNSGNYNGTMAGDVSLNSQNNTYTGPSDGFNLEGSYDFRNGDAFGSGFGEGYGDGDGSNIFVGEDFSRNNHGVSGDSGGGGGGGKYFNDQSAATLPMARGGIADAYYSLGGYSDGGRLLRGPGDGVSDSIPATIGRKKQPARLADGEFVIPARIVSELGNGSTEAGARRLYAMMDRIQATRGKTVGRGRVAANTRADRHLPA
jgi:hypothetical protein